MTQSILESIVIESPQDSGDFRKLEKLLPESYLIQSQQQNTSTRILIAKNQFRALILGAIVAELGEGHNDHPETSPRQAKRAKIAYVHVKKTWRKLQIGNALMRAAEEMCGNEGVSQISMLFNSTNHAAHALTSLKKGWSNGELIYGFTFSSKQSMGPVLDDLEKLDRRSIDRSTGVTVLPLRSCDRDTLIHASQANEIPEWAQLNQHKLESSSQDYSRVVYRDNLVIGWLITYPLGQETLDYRILWTEHAHRKTGATLSALIEIIREAHFQDQKNCHNEASDLGIPWQKGFFLVHSDNQAMTNFANKRLESAKQDKSQLIFKEKKLSLKPAQKSEAR